MARRTGVSTIKGLAQRLCQLTTAFSPIIRRVFPDNVALHVALDTANAACAVLVNELEAVTEYGD